MPCATEGTLDVLRTKVQEFCNALSFEGRKKCVILDELDSASAGSTNNFQMGLRTMIEAASDDTFFVATCNFSTKILPAIMSRCPLIPLKFDKKDLLMRVKFILDAEGVKYDREGLKSFIEEAFGFYPDCRRIVNYLQFCCASGELVVRLNQVVDSDKRGFLDELVKKALEEKDVLDVRRFYLANKDKISDYVAAGSDLFNAAVISTQVGAIKPDRRMYEAILKALDAAPEDCLFVDDRACNLEGATAMGMRAVQMARPACLPETLWEGPVAHSFKELDGLLGQ